MDPTPTARSVLAAAAVVVALSLVIGTGSSATAVAPPPAPTGNVEPTLDPVPAGMVSVAASSAPVDGRVAVIVQNGTSSPVRRLRVRGVATRADGGVATKAVTGSVLPSTLPPGAIGLAYLDFRAPRLLDGASMSFDVEHRNATTNDAPTALTVSDFALSPPSTGDVAQRLTGTVTNPARTAMRGPLLVRVMCFGESARPTQAIDTSVDRARLGAGASANVTVKLRELCPSYLVASRGRSAR